MKASLVVILSLVGLTYADDHRASFTSSGGDSDWTKLYISSDYGQPQQNLIKTRLFLNEGGPNPQLLNNRTCGGNNFNPSLSTSFVWNSSFPGGIDGNDRVVFGDPIIQPNTRIRVLNDDCNPDNSLLSLRPNRGGNDFTFIGDFLLQQPDPVVVVHYDRIGFNGSQITNGSIVVGSRPTDLCKDAWRYIPSQQINGYEQWAIEVDQLSFNDDFLSKPVKAQFSIDNYTMLIPEPYFTSLMQQMGVSTDGFVSCDIDTNSIIQFRVNGSYFKIGPSQYLDHSTVSKYGACRIRVKCQEPTKHYFTLPFTFFNNYCFLLNYKTNQIGIALNAKQSSNSMSSSIVFPGE